MKSSKATFENIHKNIPAISAVLRAIANEKRMSIIALLIQREHTPTELADLVGLSTAALSQHLNILKGYGLVDYRSEAQQRYYSCQSVLVHELFQHIGSMITKVGDGISYLKPVPNIMDGQS